VKIQFDRTGGIGKPAKARSAAPSFGQPDSCSFQDDWPKIRKTGGRPWAWMSAMTRRNSCLQNGHCVTSGAAARFDPALLSRD